jgi:hypothetical protein
MMGSDPEKSPMLADIEAPLPSTSDSSSSSSSDDGTPKRHAMVGLFHLLFKGLALLVYLFCNVFSSSYVLPFVFCVLLLAFDFWTVKNVSGRLLVGLRWWNEVLDDGSNKWIFEVSETKQVHAQDSFVFWAGIYGTPAVWLLLGLAAVFSWSFKWMPIVLVALALNGANLVGYWKCQKDSKTKLNSFVVSQLASRLGA